MRGTTAHGFVIRGSRDALQRTCDRWFNGLGAPVRCTPVSRWVLLLFTHTARAENAGARGYVAEIDVSFWVPVKVEPNGTEVRSHVGFVLPYTFVSSAYGMAMGREIYGFNKAVSEFPHSGPLPTDGRGIELSVRSLAMERLSSPTEAKIETLFEVDPGPQGPRAEGAREMASLGMLSNAILEHVGAVESGSREDTQALAAALSNGAVPLVFLKQLRDVGDPTRACYQAIVEATPKPGTPPRFRAGLLGGTPGIRLHPYESHPIALDLGIELDQDFATGAPVAFFMDFDFELDRGRALWEYGA
jgi:hypothetical protein